MAYLSTTAPTPLYAFTLQTVQITTGTPETVVNDQYQQNPLGAIMRWNDNVYRYVQFSTGTGAVAGAAGGVCYWKTLTIGVASTTSPTWLATSDQSDAVGTGSINMVAGIVKGVVTTLYYTWLGVGGTHVVKSNASDVAGDKMIGSATDLTFGRIAAGTAPTDMVYGVSMVTYSAGFSTALLQNLIW